MIIHITHADNLSSILSKGIMPPSLAQAEKATAGIGAEGSRTDVVQLLELQENEMRLQLINFAGERRRYASEHNLPIDLKKFVTLFIDEQIRDNKSFISHYLVRQYCIANGDQNKPLRYWPWYEVWFDGIVAPELIVKKQLLTSM